MLPRATDGVFALGLMIGTTTALLFVSAFGLPAWLDRGAISTLLGAVVGGLMALAAQVYATREQKLDREVEVRSRREITARGTLIKLIQISTNIFHLRNHIREGISIAKSNGYWRHEFLFVRPIAGSVTKINILEQEKSLALEWGDLPLFNDILHIDWIYNSLSDSMDTYKSLRDDAISDLVVSGGLNGVIGNSEMTSEQFARFEPRAAGLDDLLDQIISDIDKDYLLSKNTLLKMASAFEQHTGKKISVKIPDDADGVSDLKFPLRDVTSK